MTTFQERERAFEAKFAHDEEFRFLVTARRDKLFAQWAADRLQLGDPARADLTKSVLALHDGRGHDDALRSHVALAFADADSNIPEPELLAALDRCAALAQQQLLAGMPLVAAAG